MLINTSLFLPPTPIAFAPCTPHLIVMHVVLSFLPFLAWFCFASGGLSNFLYYVSLPDNLENNNKQQQQRTNVKRLRKDAAAFSQQHLSTEPKEVSVCFPHVCIMAERVYSECACCFVRHRSCSASTAKCTVNRPWKRSSPIRSCLRCSASANWARNCTAFSRAAVSSSTFR